MAPPAASPGAPRLSVVVLTLNEEANVRACLRSLARQEDRRFEVILVDAASSDATVSIAQRMAEAFPVPLRIEASPERLPIGAARNLGVALARAPNVAFLSADAEAEPGWVARAITNLERHDMVFARQVHDPHGWTTAAAVRGLRYRFPTTPPRDPLPLASNVSAAYRKDVLRDNPFDPWTNAAEDLLLARRAAAQGRTAVYDPAFAVRHHDVESARIEWRKNVREGLGWARYRGELGTLRPVLAWGVAIAGAIAFAALRPGWLALGAAVLVVYAPALRRALRRSATPMPLRARLQGLAASPLFDLAFLASYLRGLAAKPAPAQHPASLQETRT